MMTASLKPIARLCLYSILRRKQQQGDSSYRSMLVLRVWCKTYDREERASIQYHSEAVIEWKI